MKESNHRPTKRLSAEPVMLLAERHYPTVATLREIATAHGLITNMATNGPQALELLRRATPALVVLSADLETVNGFEVCARMKLMKRLRGVPVVLLAHALDERVSDASAIVRADGLLTKPLDITAAQDMIARLTRPKFYGTNLTVPLRVLQAISH